LDNRKEIIAFIVTDIMVLGKGASSGAPFSFGLQLHQRNMELHNHNQPNWGFKICFIGAVSFSTDT
jgi:hypothetical protein